MYYISTDILDLKKSKKPFATLTAYDYLSAKIVDSTGIPLILVGDSAAMVMLGYDNTLPISMDEMLVFVKAVTRATKNALVVADLSDFGKKGIRKCRSIRKRKQCKCR